MRRVLALAFCAVAFPAASQVPPAVLDAVQRLPPTRALEAALRDAACVFSPVARHLDRLPATTPWVQPDAVVLFGDLPGLGAGSRAAVLRPTRELLARAATRERIAEGDITLHDIDLAPLPARGADTRLPRHPCHPARDTRPKAVSPRGRTEPDARMTALAPALLNPRRIALVGASADPTRLTARAQVYLRKHGFDGALYPVNPRAETILGEKAYPSIAAIPGPVDLAYLLLATEHVEGVIADVAAKGIPVAAILADGFAEAGPEGIARQERLLATARAAGVRILGPNSMGLINLNARTACSVNAALEAESLPAGRLALVSQSGSMLGAIMARGAARGLGFSHLISTGNEADLTASEIAGLLVDDPQIDAILLFLEAIRRADLLEEAARRAHAAGKPIIAYKLGRSSFGAELANSHTGALAGSDAAADAFFRANGIARVTMIEALLEAPALFIGRKPIAAPKRAVSVMTTTGGGGAMAVDALGVAGIETRAPDDDGRGRR